MFRMAVVSTAQGNVGFSLAGLAGHPAGIRPTVGRDGGLGNGRYRGQLGWREGSTFTTSDSVR